MNKMKIGWYITPFIWLVNTALVLYSFLRFEINALAHLLICLTIWVYVAFTFFKARAALKFYSETKHTTIFKNYIRYEWFTRLVELFVAIIFFSACLSRLFLEKLPLFD